VTGDERHLDQICTSSWPPCGSPRRRVPDRGLWSLFILGTGCHLEDLNFGIGNCPFIAAQRILRVLD